MSTSEERMRILKMVADKHISAEEGARLLEALRAADSEVQGRPEAGKPRWVRIRVTDTATGKPKVNVNIPAGLLDVGVKMGARFAPEMAGLDLHAVQAAMKGGLQGKVIDVESEEDNERVEIFLE